MAERHHPDDRDVDAAFEAIVARWDDESTEDSAPEHDQLSRPLDAPPRRPTQSTGDVRLPPARPEGPRTPDVPWRVDPTNSVADALLRGDDDPGEGDADEGYSPPPPQPLPPPTDRLFWGGLLGLALGVLGLLWLAIARPDVGRWATVLVVGLLVGGFLCVVVRQPRDRDDDPSNGAVV